jgi:hypothetical protein
LGSAQPWSKAAKRDAETAGESGASEAKFLVTGTTEVTLLACGVVTQSRHYP